jgi:hypothetical protein
LESLERQIADMAERRELKPEEAYKKVVVVKMSADQRGKFIRVLFDAISWEQEPVRTSFSAAEWIVKRSRDGNFRIGVTGMVSSPGGG